jgi:hypothetical protein
MKTQHDDRKIDKTVWYTPAEAAKFLGVGVDTIKRYCRQKFSRETPVKAKRVGPKKTWAIQGSAIIARLKEWNLPEDAS